MGDPTAALAFGLYADRDIIDVPLAQGRSTPVAAEWLTLLNALYGSELPHISAEGRIGPILARTTGCLVIFVGAAVTVDTMARSLGNVAARETSCCR